MGGARQEGHAGVWSGRFASPGGPLYRLVDGKGFPVAGASYAQTAGGLCCLSKGVMLAATDGDSPIRLAANLRQRKRPV